MTRKSAWERLEAAKVKASGVTPPEPKKRRGPDPEAAEENRVARAAMKRARLLEGLSSLPTKADFDRG